MEFREFEGLDNELQKDKEYLSIILVGSTASGDFWTKGRSDNDILLVFKGSTSLETLKNIRNFLSSSNFDNSYNFRSMAFKEFVSSNSSHDFSHKFRSKLLFGENLISQVILPERDKIKEIYVKGLKDTILRLDNKLINAGFWSDDKIRDEFYKMFKHVFMYLSIKYYYDSGIYPKNRKGLCLLMQDYRLDEVLKILENIDNSTKEEIISCAEKISSYLKIDF